MFAKYAFRVKAKQILSSQFKYDPMNFSREQATTWGQVVGECYRANGKPVEAAVFFMMVQINVLSKGARDSEFAERTFGVIEELKYQMTPAGRDVLSRDFFYDGSDERAGHGRARHDAHKSELAVTI